MTVPGGGQLDSLWWDDLPAGERELRRPPLAGDSDADVVIVGAGFTGLWTAYYLRHRDPGLRIVVVERDTSGAGASGRNGGWASTILPLGWDAIARRHGRDATLAWQAAVDDTLAELARVCTAEGIDAKLAVDGYLEVATDPAQVATLEHDLATARRWGRDEAALRRLTGTEARSLIDSPTALAGLFTPRCGVLQPARLARGLAHAVERRGVRIVEGTAVTGIEEGTVTTDHGRVRAEVVVLAVEGYATWLAGHHRDRLPVRSTLIATEPLDAATWASIGWAKRHAFKDFRRQLFYAQRTADDRIAFGGRGAPYRFASRIDDPIRGLPAMREFLREVMVSVLPQTADAAISHVWGGVLGVPRDWMPSVRYDRGAGLAVAGGYSGDGVTLTNLAGRTLADLICERHTELVALPWVGHASRRWEPEPLRWIGTALGERLARRADAAEAEGRRAAPLWAKAFSTLTSR